MLELNGAVDFTSEYSLAGRDVFQAVAGTIDDAGAEAAPLAVGLGY